MDKAKQAVSSFISKDGQHKTIVDQDTRGAITEEHVRPHRHEEVTTAVDKEIHQDHHQTIVQPIKASETAAERHTHNAMPVEHRSFDHDKPELSRTVEQDAARYKDSSVTHDTTHSVSKAPIITGEHVHHHLHQHVQPVIQKDTIRPEVVHTTVPVHETHHAPTVSHGTTTLPTKTWAEFEKETGGAITGSKAATVGEYDGCAKTFVEKAMGAGEKHHGLERREVGSTGGIAGAGAGAGAAALPNQSTSSRSGSMATSQQHAGGAGVKSMVDPLDGKTSNSSSDYKIANQAANRAYNDANTVPRSSEPNALHNSTSGASASTQKSKVSLLDKLNPLKDADGDGKKGLMS